MPSLEICLARCRQYHVERASALAPVILNQHNYSNDDLQSMVLWKLVEEQNRLFRAVMAHYLVGDGHIDLARLYRPPESP